MHQNLICTHNVDATQCEHCKDAYACDKAWNSVDNGDFGKNYKAMPEKDEYAKLVMAMWLLLFSVLCIGILALLGVWWVISFISLVF